MPDPGGITECQPRARSQPTTMRSALRPQPTAAVHRYTDGQSCPVRCAAAAAAAAAAGARDVSHSVPQLPGLLAKVRGAWLATD
eukprot:363142-Chlamydomonas_euryale.AAC.6